MRNLNLRNMFKKEFICYVDLNGLNKYIEMVRMIRKDISGYNVYKLGGKNAKGFTYGGEQYDKEVYFYIANDVNHGDIVVVVIYYKIIADRVFYEIEIRKCNKECTTQKWLSIYEEYIDKNKNRVQEINIEEVSDDDYNILVTVVSGEGLNKYSQCHVTISEYKLPVRRW